MTESIRPQIVVPGDGGDEEEEGKQFVAQPAKLLRIASMIRGMVEEVRQTTLDSKGLSLLADVYRTSVAELKEALSPDLQRELDELAAPLEDSESESEIRIAQAQLLGWLEGLFHGIQAALWAQHMQAQATLEEMRRRQLPSGPGRNPASPDQPEPPIPPGQYL